MDYPLHVATNKTPHKPVIRENLHLLLSWQTWRNWERAAAFPYGREYERRSRTNASLPRPIPERHSQSPSRSPSMPSRSVKFFLLFFNHYIVFPMRWTNEYFILLCNWSIIEIFYVFSYFSFVDSMCRLSALLCVPCVTRIRSPIDLEHRVIFCTICTLTIRFRHRPRARNMFAVP